MTPRGRDKSRAPLQRGCRREQRDACVRACPERSGSWWTRRGARKKCAAIVVAVQLAFAPAILVTADAVELPARVENTTLQQGNDRPKRLIQIKDLTNLAGNRIGWNFDRASLKDYPLPCPPEENHAALTVADLGLTWVRISVDYMEWDRARDLGGFSQPEVDPCYDQVVSLLASQGVTIVYNIVHWDEELHAERYPDYGNEEDVQLYLDHTRMIVQTFKDRIQYYEILNEAIVYVDLEDYINLVRRAVGVIREEYPEAKIVAGGSATLLDPGAHDFLFGLLQSDVMPLVDAIGIHPMYGVSPEFDDTREYYKNYPALVQEIKDVAEAHGFAGEYLASEMAWRTNKNPNPLEPREYPAKVAAKYYARAIVLHRGLGLWAGVAGEAFESIRPIARAVRNLGTVLDGAEPEALTVEIESDATNVLSYGFALPNGDRLFAFWANGSAIKDDAGVAATLTFPEYTAETVVGFDVLNGFRQKLITQQEGGSLVIHDLLVKDYPILVRLRQ